MIGRGAGLDVRDTVRRGGGVACVTGVRRVPMDRRTVRVLGVLMIRPGMDVLGQRLPPGGEQDCNEQARQPLLHGRSLRARLGVVNAQHAPTHLAIGGRCVCRGHTTALPSGRTSAST